MSIIKLAVYGAIGYFVYQTFFADMPAAKPVEQEAPPEEAEAPQRKSRSKATGGTRMTGGGAGRTEKTAEATGGAVSHRVGRGVL